MGLYTYRMRVDTVYDEDEKEYTVYGIEAVTKCGQILKSFPDIFFEKQMAEDLVKACNENKLDIIHLADVVEDAIEEQYAY